MTPEKTSFGDRLQSVQSRTLYLILIVVVSATVLISKFTAITVPNKPGDSEIDMFALLMRVPEGSTIFVESDWTKSTRGESQGQLEALLRIAMRRDLKFVIYSMTDPQAPQVARDVILRINAERQAKGQRTYQKWVDYVELGYFPNGEAKAQVIATNLRVAFEGRRDIDDQGVMRDVWQSPVMQGIQGLRDVPLYVVICASNIVNVLIERISDKVNLAAMVTGVMGPETRIYHASGQLKGLVIGLKGVYDFEMLMEFGLNDPAEPKSLKSTRLSDVVIAGFKGERNLDRASAYYPTLHVALTLLILAVVIGNVGVALSRSARRGK